MSGMFGPIHIRQSATFLHSFFQDAKAMGKLKREVERAKGIRSSQKTTTIEIEGFHRRRDLSETLTRARFVGPGLLVLL